MQTPIAPQTPSWLQGANVGGLQALQNRLPSIFNTKPLDQSYQNAIGSSMDQGRALAAAAGARYANSAMQSGASTMGAGFAEGQAMLPIYNQRNQMLSDLAGKKLQFGAAYAGAAGDVAGRIGQLMGAHQGVMADYGLGQQKLAQGESQFNSDLGFRRTQLGQQASQFTTQNNANTRLQALMLAMKAPRGGFMYNTDQFGNPMGALGASQARGFQSQNDFFNGIAGQLSNLSGV